MNAIPASARRFDGVAEAYARYRPSYPPDAIAAILDGLPSPADVVDIGAGTGIATRLFAAAAAGARVVGIEPNDDMRAAALATGLDVRAGTAYATGLAARSADLVTAFQAFHWFCDGSALAECKRILRPGGRFAAVWNERDPNDAFSAELAAVDRRHGEQQMIESFDTPSGGVRGLLSRCGFENGRRLQFANALRLDAQSAIGRLRSLSFAPRAGPALEAFIAETLALVAKYCEADVTVLLKLRTDVYLGDLPL